ncbi:hypothetical protein [Aliarcobacter butzleri]|uniref:hypothetical protein n=1 Tax=Aliarcobacter butzleri TaxID=28197 RepID=UPI003AFA776E
MKMYKEFNNFFTLSKDTKEKISQEVHQGIKEKEFLEKHNFENCSFNSLVIVVSFLEWSI